MSDINLSPKQKQIVTAPVGHMLVMATAGSGKTRVLTQRVRFLLERDPLDGVLALTFTNKAADEMRERLEGIDNLERRTWVGTIHSFAQSIVEKHGRHIGYSEMPHIFERDEDRGRFLAQAMSAYSNELRDPPVSYGNDEDVRRKKVTGFLGKISELKRSLLSDDEIETQYPEDNTAAIFREYNAILRQHNGVDFDDLLILAYRILSEIPAVAAMYARNYPHVCIDEAQDLNKAQYQLIRALCHGRVDSLMMVGDPNQAIYGFNGSSCEYMTKSFESDFQPQVFQLLENYRSTKAVLYLANQLKPNSHSIENVPLNGICELFAAPNEAEEARWICEKIVALCNQQTHPEIEGTISLDRMTVLARNRYVFITLQEKLDEWGWKWHLKKTPGAPLFESQIGKLVDLTMRVLLNPHDMLHFKELSLLTNHKWYEQYTADQIMGTMSGADDSHLTGILKYLPSVVNTLQKENAAQQPDLENVIEPLKQRLKQEDASLFTDEERDMAINDLSDLLAHWDRYVKGSSSASSLSLTTFRNAMAMGRTHLDAVPEGLSLATVHTMKGLEKDIVFLMGMNQGTFPDYRSVEAGGARFQEELNNAYVAVTRARRFIYISYPQTKRTRWGNVRSQQPSQFLQQMNLQ